MDGPWKTLRVSHRPPTGRRLPTSSTAGQQQSLKSGKVKTIIPPSALAYSNPVAVQTTGATADDDAEEFDFGAWADGYLYGSQLGQADWLETAGEHGEDLSELMEDFFLLNGAIKEDALKHGETWMSEAAEIQAMQRAADNLPTRVVAIYDFWQALRFPVEPVRRESPKVGRNDPCPCGSGRKFKQCCGSLKKLH